MNTAKDTPILAMRAGTYRERPTNGPLSRLFFRVWSHRLPQEFEGQIAVVPDGCSDLIWVGGQLMVIGPDRTAAFPALAPGETILGLRFRAGAALRWLDVPLHELVGRAVPLRELRDDVQTVEERLAEANCAIERRLLFEAWAAGEASLANEPQSAMKTLFDELGSGVLHGSSATEALGERTLRRRSHDHFGYGPKTLERILRLQRLLRMVRQPASGNLAILALEAGYADQAHMTRDVKELTTFTPWEIRRQLCA
ncbi:helix-turn-helix domain-containing protein [Neorhizobium galegae]|uniref:XylDLEGF operon transcriptional activator 1 n=1 Tax=Neorhizobium galegae bv. orientalis str. HAMBI 540 TaxID=1028800 RepID=A0A068SQP2_NEOGA|nr:helix-turn-helix domain-containing protein [Neorhizobium galegae]CDN48184.1 XylDLEGF operon transcriptional activator 1 [Neorhizobium galegae bv. orientalis str. HAMBI 540]CDZ46438.1 Transcriptional regulator [Neorhizobium galegae bv. orientalis]